VAEPSNLTTSELLAEGVERLRASGSETARLDAELLLGDAVGVGRTVLLAHPDAPVGAGAIARYREGLDRRATGEPVAYIRGMKEFFGLAFSVDRRALIPRPETERLVELAEQEVRSRLRSRVGTQAPIRIADVGTGSGAIAITLAVRLRSLGALQAVELVAVDVENNALQLAKENAVGHAVADGITFGRSDLLVDVSGDRFDLVLANLPYVRRDAIPSLPVAASFEPVAALDGGADGLEVISRLLAQLPDALATDGTALLEIGSDQGDAIVDRCSEVLPGWTCAVELDLAGRPRVARVSRT
jgi:release factor glutamine methyltransferase